MYRIDSPKSRVLLGDHDKITTFRPHLQSQQLRIKVLFPILASKIRKDYPSSIIK